MKLAVAWYIEHFTGGIHFPLGFPRQQHIQRTAHHRHLFRLRGTKGIFPFCHHPDARAAGAAAGEANRFHFSVEVFIALKHKQALMIFC